MEDNYFDKKLRDILNNPPPFEPDPGAIEDMRRRLEAPQVKNRQGAMVLWWLLPLLVLPFLFSSFFFYFKYQNINQKLDDITLQLTKFQKETTTQNHTTFHYDTIYNVIYKDIIVERTIEQVHSSRPVTSSFRQNIPLLANRSKSPSLTGFSLLKEEPFVQQAPYNDQRSSLLNLFLDEGLASEPEKMQRAIGWQIDSLGSIDYLPLKQAKLEAPFANIDEQLNDLELDERKRKVNPVYYFIPKGFNIGGTAMPFISGKANGTRYTSSSFGIKGALEFYNGIELQVGLERLGINFELKDPNAITSYPVLPPDNPGDLLKEMYVDLSYVQIPITLKKYFRKGKDLAPFIGIGMVAQKPLKQNFDYEYINGAFGEYTIQQSFSEGSFSIENLRSDIGVRYRFWKHFSAQAAIVYQHAFEQGSEEYFPLRYWGANIGLQYHFN